MHFSALPNTLLLALALHCGVNAASSDDKKIVDPCTVASPNGNFYDLRALTATLPKDGKKPGKHERTEDWHAKGYDYEDGKANFTLNICAPVVGKVEDVVGLEEKLWTNVSAHYTLGEKTYSIG
jgi:cation-dependent mannose-6-phosphate receptor